MTNAVRAWKRLGENLKREAGQNLMKQYPKTANLNAEGFIMCSEHPDRIAIALPFLPIHGEDSLAVKYNTDLVPRMMISDLEGIRRIVTCTAMCAPCTEHLIRHVTNGRLKYGLGVYLMGQIKVVHGEEVVGYDAAFRRPTEWDGLALHPTHGRPPHILSYGWGAHTRIFIHRSCDACVLKKLKNASRIGVEVGVWLVHHAYR